MTDSYSLASYKGSTEGRFAAVLRAEDTVAAVLFRNPDGDAVGYTKGIGFAPVQWMLEKTGFTDLGPDHTIDFYPLFQCGNTPQWDDGLTEEQRKDDQQLLFKLASHLKEISTHTPIDLLQKMWAEYGPHSSVSLYAQPFNVMNQPSGFVPERKVNEYKVPEPVLETYRSFLGKQFGENNVFVNPQVQSMDSLLENWNDFEVQAHDRLLEGLRYRRPMYDFQEVRDDILTVPVYGFSVGIKREWPNAFTVGDYLNRMEASQSIEVKGDGIKEMMLELDRSVFMVDTKLYDQPACQAIYDNFYRMVQTKIAQARWENRTWFRYKLGCLKKQLLRLWKGQLST